MEKTFTGTEFIKALTEGTLAEPIVKHGMAKQNADDAESILFAKGTACELWTKIPVAMIERVEFVRTIRCRDHEHPFVRITLKEPPADNPLAGVLAELIRRSSRPSQAGRAAPAPERRVVMPPPGQRMPRQGYARRAGPVVRWTPGGAVWASQLDCDQYFVSCHGGCLNGDIVRGSGYADDCNGACEACYASLSGQCEGGADPNYRSCDYCDCA